MLPEKGSQFREDQPCIIVFGVLGEGAQMPNFVLESAGAWDTHFCRDSSVGCIGKEAYL